MGYDIRPLATLAGQARQFFTQAVPGAIVRLWANTFTVFGKVFALLDFEHEMRRKWLFDQLFASTAEMVWLIRHGFELGLAPDTGNAASGIVTVACQPGTPLPQGIRFQRADGVTYSTLASATSPGTSVDLVVQADDVGAASNVVAGDTLNLVVASGVPFQLGKIATVGPAGISGGADAEDPETFRARVLYRKRNPPLGGSAPDYVEWTGEALASVARVYVDSFANDSRSVWLCFTVSDRPNGVPDAGQVATVQAYVRDPVRRPITARVFATAPTPVPQSIVLANVSPFNADVMTAIEVELGAMFADEVQPATPSQPFTLFLEDISGAVKRATGLKNFTLVSPTADQTFSTGSQLPTFGSVSYQ